MDPRSEFLEPTDPRWQQVLSRCVHDFYHLPGYVALEGQWLKAQALAFCHESDGHVMLLPLLERPTPGGTGTDAVTPYGYSCPVFSSGCSQAFRVHALQAFQDAAVQRGLISTFMRLHPLIEYTLPQPLQIKGGEWTQTDRGFTVDLPLATDHEAWILRIAGGHRSAIRRLQRNGATFVMDTPQAIEEFPRIYQQTMEKLSAQSVYFYTADYFERFRQALGDKAHCAAVLSDQGEVMSAGLFTHVSGIVQYHLSGTDPRFNKQAPMKLLLSGVREWSRQQGARSFHLGGGLGGAKDSLYEFKEQFGGQSLTFRTVSIIHDPRLYAQECDARAARALAGPSSTGGFFPAYRAPLPQGAST